MRIVTVEDCHVLKSFFGVFGWQGDGISEFVESLVGSGMASQKDVFLSWIGS